MLIILRILLDEIVDRNIFSKKQISHSWDIPVQLKLAGICFLSGSPCSRPRGPKAVPLSPSGLNARKLWPYHGPGSKREWKLFPARTTFNVLSVKLKQLIWLLLKAFKTPNVKSIMLACNSSTHGWQTSGCFLSVVPHGAVQAVAYKIADHSVGGGTGSFHRSKPHPLQQ